MKRNSAQFDSRARTRGYTLLELVVASASAAILVGGLSSSLYIASQSLEVNSGSLAKSRTAQQAIATINRNLQTAISLSELTATSITMSVPDRNGDSVPETIRYSWSGTAGDPLTEEYNGGTATTHVDDVQSLSFAWMTRLIEGISSNPIVLFVSGQAPDGDGGLGTPTAAEQQRIDLMEGWGYDVTVISQQATQVEFDAEFANATVVYVSGVCNAGTLGTKLNAAAIGVVTESFIHAETLGFYVNLSGFSMSNTEINLVNTTHYITTGLAVGTLEVFSSDQELKWTSSTLAPDAATLANVSSALNYPTLLTLDAGDELADSSAAAGRRCQLPWGESAFDATALNTDGQLIMRRSLEWAAGAGDDTETTGLEYKEFEEDTASGTSITVDRPAGTSTGDLLIAAVATDGSTEGSLAPPAGWNQIDLAGRDGRVTLGVWWKNATASEPSNYDFTWSGSQEAYGWIMRFTGHDGGNPIDDYAASGGRSSNPECPEVTSSVDGSLILRIGGFDSNDISVDAPGLTGLTSITMDESSNSSTRSASGGAGYFMQTTAGGTGTVDFALTGSEEYRTVTIAIAPDSNP